MRAYSLDLRQRIVAAVAAGMPVPEAARLFAVSVATVNRYRKRLREAGGLAPGRSPGRPRALAPGDEPALVAQLEAQPDARLADHCRAWAGARGAAMSPATMGRAIRRLGWTRKKSRWRPASATRPSASSGATTPGSST
jgi:transposase